MLRLHTSGTTQRIWAATLVQAATLGEGVRNFLFDAFLHFARHERPSLATPDGESPPPKGDRVWLPPNNWGRHLVGQPERARGRLDTKGRTRYHEPNMAHPPPSTTPIDTMAWKRRTWVDRLTFLSTFRGACPGGTPQPRQPAARPLHLHDSHVQETLHPLNHPLPHTKRHPAGPLHQILPPRRLHPPPRTTRGHDTYTREDEPDEPHITGTWGCRSLDTVLSIRSRNQGLGRVMYCVAKWTQRTWQIPAEQWAWKVTLRPQQREAPMVCTGPSPPRPITIQLCLNMVAARLMTLLWPGPDTPTQNYPHLTEDDMPGIKHHFFGTLECLQQAQPDDLELQWTPLPQIVHLTAHPRQLHDATAHHT